jgi:hypothetical protein
MSPHTTSSQRLTQLLLAILAIGVWGLLVRPYLPIATAAAKSRSATPASFDTITVQRINVADADGTPRLVIANGARLPGAIVHGKEYPRSINDAAGALFLDTKGEETGGIALSKLRDNNVATAAYPHRRGQKRRAQHRDAESRGQSSLSGRQVAHCVEGTRYE